MIIKGKNNQEIKSVEDWFKYASPAQGSKHWKESRSALELAKSWFQNDFAQIPKELDQLFRLHPITQDLKIKYVFREKETPLDSYGKGRNHDLILVGSNQKDRILISIEAKADESYGDLVHKRLQNASLTSNIPKRIEQLTAALLGNKPSHDLRYQLLHGIAGTLIEAKIQKASQAIFIVHEFHSESLNDNYVKRNAQDLNDFAFSLINQPVSVNSNELIGPIQVPGGRLCSK